MPTLTGRPKPGDGFSLELKDLLCELRRRQWTLIRWGPENAPDLMAAMFKWDVFTDVLILRNESQASAYRVPTMGDTAVFNPERVSYQYHANPLWTLRAILALPAPGKPGAPIGVEPPTSECFIPEYLPQPVLVRPLSPSR